MIKRGQEVPLSWFNLKNKQERDITAGKHLQQKTTLQKTNKPILPEAPEDLDGLLIVLAWKSRQRLQVKSEFLR